MGDAVREIEQALRGLARTPVVTLAAVLTLALGIGANTLGFSVVRSVLLRPLPFPEPHELVVVRETRDGSEGNVAPANYLDWRREVAAFEALAAYRRTTLDLRDGDRPSRVAAADVSGNFFAALGIAPHLGRSFDPALRLDPGRRVAVLGFALWRDRFGADSALVGRTIRLEDLTYEVVGVMPHGFAWPRGTELWTRSPWEAPEIRAAGDAVPTMRNAWYFEVLGRLAPGATPASATAELEGLAAGLAARFPETNQGRGILIRPLHEDTVSGARPLLLLLMGALGLVLLVACANVASLMLVRATTRARQQAIRAALGAGRGRLIWSSLMENGLVAAAGGALGLLLTLAGLAAAGRLPASVTAGAPVELDGGVLLFSFVLVIATGLAFGTAPALAAGGAGSRATLLLGSSRDGGTSMRRSGRLQALLVASEVALAVVLVGSTALLLRSVSALTAVDPGFDPRNLVTVGISLPEIGRLEAPERTALHREILDAARGAPGVESAALMIDAPVSVGPQAGLNREDIPTAPNDWPSVGWQPVSPGVFRTLGTAVVAGRSFSPDDVEGAEDVGVVNEALARTLFPGGDALGRRVSIGLDGHDRWITVVGVVRDIRNQGPASPPAPVLYRPLAQAGRFPMESLHLTVRGPGGGTLMPGLRQAVERVVPGAPLYGEATGRELTREFTTDVRLLLRLLGGFGAVALALGMVGIYGVTAHAVGARRREIGVRMAVGADRWRILILVLQEGMAVVGGGVAVGLILAVVAGRALDSFLFQVSPTDPVTLAAVAGLLLLAGAAALAIPAHQASGVHPTVVLRE